MNAHPRQVLIRINAVRFAYPVLVHEAGEDSEGGAGLGHNGDGDGGAHSVLPLLHLQVVQQGRQHIVGTEQEKTCSSIRVHIIVFCGVPLGSYLPNMK
jgi:hypothetical protein